MVAYSALVGFPKCTTCVRYIFKQAGHMLGREIYPEPFHRSHLPYHLVVVEVPPLQMVFFSDRDPLMLLPRLGCGS